MRSQREDTRRLWAAMATLVIAGASSAAAEDRQIACEKRDYGYGSFVCVCDSAHCDTLPLPAAPPAGHAAVYTSSKDGLRFRREDVAFLNESSTPKADYTLTVDRSVTYQKVRGFGGAFTDAAGINILSLPQDARESLLESYFGADGLGYNIGRVPIAGADFSTRGYSYDDTSRNASLSGFKLQPEDYDYKIPMIKRARQLIPRGNDDLLMIASAWSPPPWMKTNNDFSGFGFLKEEYYQPWADYHIKFLEAYFKEGVYVWALTTGNEPLNGVLPINAFNSLGWTPETHRRWIGENLGPTLRDSAFAGTLLLGFDDQRIVLPWWMDLVLSDKKAASYLDGIAVHWYLDFLSFSSNLDKVHDRHPDKFLIYTEACNGDKPWDFKKVRLGDWERGEYYMSSIINVMNHWVTGWVDWNLALSETGGPNWKKNFVDATIIVNATSGEFYKQPTFYAMGHVSKFVPRDSLRVKLDSKGGSFFSGYLETIAFLRPDKAVSVVIANRHKNSRTVIISDPDHGKLLITIPARSFTTVLIGLPSPTPSVVTTK